MEYFFYSCLFVFWTLFWSFGSVIIYRLKSWEGGISTGRSHCPACNTMLKAIDLIPIFSWLKSKAKCKYCMTKVSHIYPILELVTWLTFAFIWYFLIDYTLITSFNSLELIKLLFWLSIWFITILYIFYDILFLEIHEWILLTWIWIIIAWLIWQTLFEWFNLISILPSWIDSLWVWIWAIALSITIIWLLYLIMLKEYHELTDSLILLLIIWSLVLFKQFTWVNLTELAILNWLIWVLIVFIFFFLQIVISKWTWMWWGDLRIAIMIWLILWVNFIFPWLMLTYMAWSIIWVWYIIHNRVKNGKNKLNTQIPFWPFLAIWFFLTVFYSTEISDFISIYF